MQQFSRLILPAMAVACTLVFAGLITKVQGQPTPLLVPSAPSSSATPTPSAAAAVVVVTPTPIPLAEVVTQAELATASLRDTEADLSSDQITATIEQELPALTHDIDARLEENSRLLTPSPSLETLRALETGWQNIGGNVSAWARSLRTNAGQLDKKIVDLNQLEETWKQTLTLAQSSAGAPRRCSSGLSCDRRDGSNARSKRKAKGASINASEPRRRARRANRWRARCTQASARRSG
ncbi:MAG: hypothetical protein WKF84_06215 [Pyrinomonadaceae bacterium]